MIAATASGSEPKRRRGTIFTSPLLTWRQSFEPERVLIAEASASTPQLSTMRPTPANTTHPLGRELETPRHTQSPHLLGEEHQAEHPGGVHGSSTEPDVGRGFTAKQCKQREDRREHGEHGDKQLHQVKARGLGETERRRVGLKPNDSDGYREFPKYESHAHAPESQPKGHELQPIVRVVRLEAEQKRQEHSRYK